LYKSPIERIGTRALLCHVYHLSLRDQYSKARDILLMSHLQDNISSCDISTQTLYNRTMVQIGLCSFRLGRFRDAHDILQEICSSSKIKELLAQGVSGTKYSERTYEQEKLDRASQLPFHMHVNLDLLECVYLVSAMLLEIPNMAKYRDSKKRVISKSFRRMIEYNEKQTFIGIFIDSIRTTRNKS
jgi:translation initiation factor 3 subunit C